MMNHASQRDHRDIISLSNDRGLTKTDPVLFCGHISLHPQECLVLEEQHRVVAV
jgi:hypothetical protein